MSTPAPGFVTRLDGEATEKVVSHDIVRRGLYAAPVLILLCGAIWGVDGIASSAFAIALILVNFLVAAALITVTARISLGLMMGAVLFGYLIRLALIFLAVMLVKDASWVNLTALGLSIIITHLGLLFWELKYVSASLAYPALKPSK
ncbi:MAG TPA: ATP synthase subunit I [Acidimicrobiales bacterium]